MAVCLGDVLAGKLGDFWSKRRGFRGRPYSIIDVSIWPWPWSPMVVHIQQVEEIDCPVEQVFSTITDLEMFTRIATDLSNVHGEMPVIDAVGQVFHATKTIHGRAQEQTYVVVNFDAPNRYSVETTLFRMPVKYDWTLVEAAKERTNVTLGMSAQLDGWTRIFSPLLRHLFTRPEHDRHLLRNLKRVVSGQV